MWNEWGWCYNSCKWLLQLISSWNFFPPRYSIINRKWLYCRVDVFKNQSNSTIKWHTTLSYRAGSRSTVACKSRSADCRVPNPPLVLTSAQKLWTRSFMAWVSTAEKLLYSKCNVYAAQYFCPYSAFTKLPTSVWMQLET